LVTGWQPDVGGRLRATVELGNFRQLYVNGTRVPRARGAPPAGLQPWGKQEGVIHPAPGQELYGTLEVTAAAGYRTSNAKLAEWTNPSDMEFGYYNSWSHMVCRLQSIAREGDGAVIAMAQPGFFLASNKGGVQAGMPAYMENALELLDEPGEWYFDRPAHTLYYLPRPGEDLTKAEVIAPALTTLVEVKGSLEQPVHDLSFEGLTFAHATWLRPSELGHPDVQANFISPCDNSYMRPEFEKGIVAVNGEMLRSPANVLVDAAKGVHFEGCTFTALGGAGLDLQDGAQDNVVSGCRFSDISASGIQVGDVTREDHHPTDPRRVVKGNQIVNNVITRVGVEYQDSIGVFCGYTDSTVIAYNEIGDLPYTGVSVGWGWGMPDAGGGAYKSAKVWDVPTACRSNRIEFNHIHHVMQQRNDGGGIYTLSRQPGTIIRGNHIHDNGPGAPGGIYLDEGSADIEVTGNLVYAVGRPMNYNNHAQNRIASCREHDNLFGQVRTTTGLIGAALQCGSGSFLEVPHAPELDSPQLTVEAWIRIKEFPSGWDPRRWAVCKAANEWDNGNYSLYLDKNNVGAYLNIGGGRENQLTAASTDGPLKLNTWCQIALTYDGDTLRTFCDGRQVAETRVGRARTVSTSPLTLGARMDRYSYFEGDLDEVRIYSRALTVEEITSNYEAVRAMAGQGGKEPQVVRDHLAGYWGFEDLALPPEQVTARQAVVDSAGLEPPYRHLLEMGPPGR
jgi:hypothetical protein